MSKEEEYKMELIKNKELGAIKDIEDFIEYGQDMINDMEYERPVDVTIYQHNIDSMNTILKSLSKKDKVIEEMAKLLIKKDKVIDLMANEIATPGNSIEMINLYNNVSPDKPIYDLVKEYFYKKAEEENEQ